MSIRDFAEGVGAACAILPALQAEELGYTDFEAYLALYLRKEFVPIQFQNGTYPAHEARLRELGRHVEVRIDRLEDLVPKIEEALHDASFVDPHGSRNATAWREFWGTMRLGAFLVLAAIASFVLQFSATALNNSKAAIDARQWLDHCAAFACSFSVHF